MGAVRRIRQRMRRAVQAASESTQTDGSTGETVNVSNPSNVVVSGNIGESGAVHGTSTRQTVRVRQNGEETYEESETTETHIR